MFEIIIYLLAAAGVLFIALVLFGKWIGYDK